jgi:uncharacterized tellurite resistance protein B-like protein
MTTFPDLAAFLMLYVARVDGNAHYLEEATLAGQLKAFAEDSEALLHRISAAYPKIEDEKIEVVLKVHEDIIRSASPEQRKQLIESLFAIVNSDGKVQSEEMGALRVIRGALS